MGTYGSLGVGVGRGRRRWGGAWFALVLTFRKEGRDVGVEKEGKATANGFEEGFVGSGRGEDEAVEDKRGAPEMGRVVVGRGQSPDGAEDSTVRATDGSWDLLGEDPVTLAKELGSVGREGAAQGVGGSSNGRQGAIREGELIVGGVVAKLEVAEMTACFA